MREEARKKRNQDRLLELFPTFRVRVERVILELERQGFRPRIQDAWRSLADQAVHVANGTSKTLFGFHNVTASNGSKEALAVDLLDDDFPEKPGTNYLLHLAAAAQAEGLTTGLRWGLEEDEIAKIDQAIASQDWDAIIRRGFDTWHVEPTDITIPQAKAGLRPA
jgi:hypothetical protein